MEAPTGIARIGGSVNGGRAMSLYTVFRYDPTWPKVRLFRIVWNVGVVGDGEGYSRKLAFALRPRLFEWRRGCDEWRLVVLGIEVHARTAWGGRFV
jgi:hypothetical protein